MHRSRVRITLRACTARHQYANPPGATVQILLSAKSFVISQVGLSAFSRADGGGYVAKTFNFWTFPRTFDNHNLKFTSEAGSLEYLAQVSSATYRLLNYRTLWISMTEDLYFACFALR